MQTVSVSPYSHTEKHTGIERANLGAGVKHQCVMECFQLPSNLPSWQWPLSLVGQDKPVSLSISHARKQAHTHTHEHTHKHTP